MKNFILLIVLLVTFSFNAFAENTDKKPKDRINFKTGEYIDGTIIGRNNEKVTISDASDGIVREFLMEEVSYISHAKKKRVYNKNRFRGMLEFGYGLGVGSPRNNTFMIQTAFGYQFSHYLFVGAGIGVDFHSTVLKSYPFRQDQPEGVQVNNDPNWRFPYVPLYLNIRSQLYESNRITPFIDLKAGMSIFNYNGFYGSPAIGLHLPTSSMFSVNFLLGCSMQHVSYKLWTSGATPGALQDGSGKAYLNEKKLLKTIDFRIGFEF